MRRILAWIGANIDTILALSLSGFVTFVGLVYGFEPSIDEAIMVPVLSLLLLALLRIEARLNRRLIPTARGSAGLLQFIRRNVATLIVIVFVVAIAPLEVAINIPPDTMRGVTLLIVAVFAIVVMRLRTRIMDRTTAADAHAEIGGTDRPIQLEDRFVAIGRQLSRLAGELNLLQAEVQARATTAAKLAAESSERHAQAERDRQYAQEQQEAAVAVDQLVRARAEPIIEAITARSRRDQLVFLLLGVPIGVAVNAVWKWFS